VAGAAEEYLKSMSEVRKLEDEALRAKRQLVPLEVEQAQLDIAKARREAQQPKAQSIGQGSFAVIGPVGSVQIRQLGPQPQKDPTNVARLKYILNLCG
jgi:hypothetical protein